VSYEFVEISAEEIDGNAFKQFGNDWPLLTAGTLKSFNSMTVGWGGFGVVWSKKIAITFVRPQRYTYQFLEKEPCFSLSFFNESYKKTLNYFGTKSGRDVNKAKETGLTPVEFDKKSVYYKEADMVVVLRKIYFQDLDPKNFIGINDKDIYPDKDYHRIYIGEILNVIVKR
jgi:flavin reductase (DIM6/NTAB) family NADH-FMN oxidoreductase RutF